MSDKAQHLRALFNAPLQFGNHEQVDLLRDLVAPCECGSSEVCILPCGDIACLTCCEKCSWEAEDCQHLAAEDG